MDIRKLQRAIVDGLEDVKANDIVVFNTEHLSPLFERVIIATGSSNRQTKALASSVRDAVKSRGMQVLSTEGSDTGEWIIVDCGAAVAHIMQPAIRQYYQLEEIWGEKPVRMKIESQAGHPAARSRSKAADGDGGDGESVVAAKATRRIGPKETHGRSEVASSAADAASGRRPAPEGAPKTARKSAAPAVAAKLPAGSRASGSRSPAGEGANGAKRRGTSASARTAAAPSRTSARSAVANSTRGTGGNSTRSAGSNSTRSAAGTTARSATGNSAGSTARTATPARGQKAAVGAHPKRSPAKKSAAGVARKSSSARR